MARLDVLIAFAVVMLGLSVLITTLTQMVSAVLGYRGTNLRWGLIQLLKSVDPTLEANAEKIAQEVLTHPLLSDSNVAKFARRFAKWPLVGPYFQRLHLASAISVSELTGILRQTASNVSLAGGVEAWFNSAMARVGQRFTMQMRIWTILFALGCTLLLHLDATRLLSQLSADPQATARLVEGSKAVQTLSSDMLSDAQATGDHNDEQIKRLAARAHKVYELFGDANFQLIPQPYPSDFKGDSLLGLLISAVLLSLGAPFWFNALKTLCSLKPEVSSKQKELAGG